MNAQLQPTYTRDDILDALSAFANQRPGLEFGNYGDVKTWNNERRAILRDLQDFRVLVAAVRWRNSIGVLELREAFKYAFSGRLTLRDDGTLTYCTGQYWPTEYRKAACAVLALALWEYKRGVMVPDTSGDDMRAYFRREFGARMARRWFA